MRDEQRSSKAWEEGVIEVILFLAAFMGLKDLIIPFAPSSLASLMDPATSAVVVVFTVAVVLYVLRVRRDNQLKYLHPFPQSPTLFNPFNLDRSDGKKHIWPRNGEVAKLAKQLQTCTHRHLIVVGQSGAGKSTLVREILTPLISKQYDHGSRVLSFETYGSFSLDLIQRFSGDSTFF